MLLLMQKHLLYYFVVIVIDFVVAYATTKSIASIHFYYTSTYNVESQRSLLDGDLGVRFPASENSIRYSITNFAVASTESGTTPC